MGMRAFIIERDWSPGSRGKSVRRRPRGFTVIELLITMAIIFTLAAIAIPSMLNAIGTARNARAVGDVRTIGDEIMAYIAEYNVNPVDLSAAGYPNYQDPWGNRYVYLDFTASGASSQMRRDQFLSPFNTYFDLYSKGADGLSTVSITTAVAQDDIFWAQDGDYVGLVSNY